MQPLKAIVTHSSIADLVAWPPCSQPTHLPWCMKWNENSSDTCKVKTISSSTREAILQASIDTWTVFWTNYLTGKSLAVGPGSVGHTWGLTRWVETTICMRRVVLLRLLARAEAQRCIQLVTLGQGETASSMPLRVPFRADHRCISSKMKGFREERGKTLLPNREWEVSQARHHQTLQLRDRWITLITVISRESLILKADKRMILRWTTSDLKERYTMCEYC